ncbi:MAG: hypothetical protein HC906_07680 [Bacteroidales bacterium]|nr:hypothetical protein [Bacteroidales bacterium]
MVDQFGYRPFDTKIAVIIDPQLGFNASDEFIPGTTYEVRNWETDEVVFSGKPQPYKNMATDAVSGDRGWWFDFTPVLKEGDYYIFDVEKMQGLISSE